jgi:hypothetical protein
LQGQPLLLLWAECPPRLFLSIFLLLNLLSILFFLLLLLLLLQQLILSHPLLCSLPALPARRPLLLYWMW